MPPRQGRDRGARIWPRPRPPSTPAARLGGRFGAAGARVLVEEFLEGEIASQFALCDGTTSLLFGGVQDAKRAFDGDKGPNTGGMGAYAPAPVLSEAVVEAARARLIAPAFAGIAAEGAPYRGVIFCEMMVTREGPKLVEYNARFGDPGVPGPDAGGWRAILVPYLRAAATGRLAEQPPPKWRKEAAVCVVMAANGYPDAPEAGSVIGGAEADFGARRGRLSRWDPAAGRRGAGRRRWAGAERLRARAGPGSRARQGLCGRRADRLARRLLPHRHRPARRQRPTRRPGRLQKPAGGP